VSKTKYFTEDNSLPQKAHFRCGPLLKSGKTSLWKQKPLSC